MSEGGEGKGEEEEEGEGVLVLVGGGLLALVAEAPPPERAPTTARARGLSAHAICCGVRSRCSLRTLGQRPCSASRCVGRAAGTPSMRRHVTSEDL